MIKPTPAQLAAAAYARALRQKNNENAAKYFAISIAGLIVIFSIIHWIELTFLHRKAKKDGPKIKKVVSIYR
jgi:hypothetical protein